MLSVEPWVNPIGHQITMFGDMMFVSQKKRILKFGRSRQHHPRNLCHSKYELRVSLRILSLSCSAREELFQTVSFAY